MEFLVKCWWAAGKRGLKHFTHVIVLQCMWNKEYMKHKMSLNVNNIYAH